MRRLLASLALLTMASPRVVADETPVDFTRDIRPLLTARCVSCHGATRQRGGLRLDRRAAALRGGDDGPVIVPHRAERSALIRRVTSTDKAVRMPAGGAPLSPAQIALLRRWIAQGAPWPEDGSASDSTETHWAFRPVVRPAPPAVNDAHWPRNPIDAFILARLEQKGLTPSPEADRATLIRRLTFDLLGLAPSPEEIEAFVRDPHPNAYERLVERTLARPHYGERWARHWLDVVRFAESDGFETNQPRPNAWPYRDYVIRALNEDRPYDQFVREQLAGDTAGADAATGFLVGGPVDRVKSPDPALTAMQRADVLHDMVSTTGSTFLGLTVGCARCHNHKFDPVSQRDYYALVAVFAGVRHGERPLGSAIDPAQRRRAKQLRAELAALDAQARAAEPVAQPGGPAGRRAPVSPLRNVERFEPITARWVRFTILATNSAEPCLDELEIYTAGPAPRNVALASLGARVSSSGDYPGNPIHKLAHLNDGRYGNGRSWISNTAGSGWVQLELARPEVIDRIEWARDREGRYADRLAVRYRIEAAAAPGRWRTVASSDDRAAPGGAAGGLLARRAALEKQLRAAERPLMAYAGTFAAPGATHRLHRGDPMQKREPIAPAAPASLGPKLTLPADTPERERRKALAAWIADARNPLTARVLVNRLWHYHFGTGIVSTPSDFGRNGGPPSHPELLDWLASEFVARGWSLKQIHRLIVTSATYRQASAVRRDGLAADARSRLLWRYPPRRLEAEALRDAILQTSGKLDRRMGGPGFDLFEPNTNYVRVYTPRKNFGPTEWRRLIYQSRPRMQPDDTFGAFDSPDGGQIAPSRNRSTTPLQALNLLNSRFLVQQSAFFADRVAAEAGPSVEARVRRAFRLAFGRIPTAEEQTAAVALVREHGLAALCRALLNANEFVYVF